ncbi:FAD-dependent oxidoreductase [Agromyces seonyuensis]|uniref:NAD(P)-binding protein n=1 Tax=Agromyces seonyuensis TaxID=2662446 RepID=A0A6I4P5F1_9MICO|nr:FAD-dependent oxidoreductase [Agromyces seonyuensis]MWC00266.1 NAD(P)-binding protein [Agromyces seonyuensis]
MERLGEPAPAVADVVVIGGGVAGLVAARECARVGLSTVVLEESDRFGGCVRRVDLGGYLVDAGASYFEQGDGSVAELAAELGLGSDIVAGGEEGVHVWVPPLDGAGRSRALPLPAESIWGVPSNPLAPDVREIVGGRGVMRAWGDRVMPFLKIGRATSFGKLVRTRMGDLVADRLAFTTLYGLFVHNADDVDVDLVVPGLNQAITRTGSLSGGIADVLGNRPDVHAAGIRGGMTRLVDALLRDLGHYDARLEAGSSVVALEPFDGDAALADADADAASDVLGDPPFRPADPYRWLVRAEALDGEEPVEQRIAARYVVVAAPARAALGLLGGLGGPWASFAAEDWRPGATDTVVLLVEAPELDAGERRVVFVPRADPDIAARSVADETARWEWLDGQTGPGLRVLRLHYDPEAHPELEALDDEALIDLALADAARALDAPLDRDRLVGAARVAHRDTGSAFLIGQRERIALVRKAVDAVPGLELTGAWLAGPRLSRVVPDSRAAARRIRRLAFRGASGRAD